MFFCFNINALPALRIKLNSGLSEVIMRIIRLFIR